MLSLVLNTARSRPLFERANTINGEHTRQNSG